MRSQLRLLEACHTGSGEAVWVDVTLSPRRVRARCLGMALLGLLLASGLLTVPPAGERPQRRLARVTVGHGDTLWSLARAYAGTTAYLPKAVEEIRQANHLRNSALKPGQSLLIPVEDAPRPVWPPDAVLAQTR